MQNKTKKDSSTYKVNSNPICYDYMVQKYQYYKNGWLNEKLSEKEQLEVDVLNVLEKLGYSMQETGTYFYKDVIVKATKALQNSETNQEYMNLITEMNNNYSQFYFDIARNGYDIGLKTFHKCIELSHQNRNSNLLNINLQQEIGLNEIIKNYKQEALLIASYMTTKTPKEQKPVAKKMVVNS
ncbi:MAG TPA: hypothetical protein IAB35_02725 [Candidatus Faecimonas gallistercoris]|nr:hypothetical protein [Candidatus Faecimonas gallistercoris]